MTNRVFAAFVFAAASFNYAVIAQTSDGRGYINVPARNAAIVKQASSEWMDCAIYGIGQVEDRRETAATVADAVMAGCMRAQTHFEDEAFRAMKGQGPMLEGRAQAHGLATDLAPKLRAIVVRRILMQRAKRP